MAPAVLETELRRVVHALNALKIIVTSGGISCWKNLWQRRTTTDGLGGGMKHAGKKG
jgi:hypothetical protein